MKNKESLPDIENIFIINTKNELVDVGDNTVFQKILVSKFDDSVEKLFKTLDPSIKETLEKDNLYQRDYFENKEEKIVYYSKIKIGKITLGYLEIDFTMKYINQKIKDVQFRIIMFIMVFLLVGIIISYVLTSKIIRPIKTLSEGVQIIGNGDLHHHIHIKSNDELENLATEFNHMTDKLLRAQKSLVEKERLDEQLEIARTIQENLLPEKIPVLPEVEISTFYKAAKGVGGDYYDLIHLKEEGKIGTLIADVSGKGVPAALIMVMIRTIFHTSFNYLKSTDNVIQNINQGLTRRLTGEKFVTMFFFIYNVKTGELEFSNAAHSALLVYKKNKNEIIELDAEGVPLGLETSAHYHARTTSLDPGDIIITYTDGITEAMNNKNELFRLRRLKEIIMQNTTLSAGSLKDKIISEINNFTGDAPQHDDMTLVIYTIKKIEGKPLTHQNTPINQIKNSIINPLDPYSILI